MVEHWFMLTVVGKDKPGIVASISEALSNAGCNFGEASMSRLGGNFTIMLMVQFEGGIQSLEKIIAPIAKQLDLRCHFDDIEAQLHAHREPDVRISVYGPDQTGIVSHITNVLARAGLDIYDLESDVGGSDEKPVYIMHIEGHAINGVETLQHALDADKTEGIETHIEEIDTVIG